MSINKDLTLVFSSYQSLYLLKKILRKFHNKYKIIIIENSLDKKIKNFLEKKFKNTKVIIPNKNLGLAKKKNILSQKLFLLVKKLLRIICLGES